MDKSDVMGDFFLTTKYAKYTKGNERLVRVVRDYFWGSLGVERSSAMGYFFKTTKYAKYTKGARG